MRVVANRGKIADNKRRQEKLREEYRKNEVLYGVLFASPVILGFLIFVVGPMVASFYFSLTDYTIVNDYNFIGVDNYIRLFSGQDDLFYKSLSVTFYYVILSVPICLIISFLLALALQRELKGRTFFRAIYYMPTIVPIVATTAIFMWLFNPNIGLLNSVLKFFNLPTSMWIYDEASAVPSLVLMSVWGIGGSFVIFLAGLENIPRQYYEAIKVDGGGAFHKLWNITIPMMTPTIFYNLIMGLINAFQTFTQAYIMTEGGPNNATLFYSFYIYREAFTYQRMGSASAAAWILFAIILVLTGILALTSDKWIYYEGGE